MKSFTLKIFSREQPRKCSRGANVGQCEMSARRARRNLLDLMAATRSCVTEHCFRKILWKAFVKDLIAKLLSRAFATLSSDLWFVDSFIRRESWKLFFRYQAFGLRNRSWGRSGCLSRRQVRRSARCDGTWRQRWQRILQRCSTLTKLVCGQFLGKSDLLTSDFMEGSHARLDSI